MKAGLLRNSVTIQTVSFTTNSFNEAVPTWTTAATVFASIDCLSGKELFAAAAVQAQVSHKITLRYYDLKPKDRIVFGSRVFNVEYVSQLDQRPITTIAFCKEAV